ncbi:hypothetical protein B8W56_19715, partial [Cronobacter sakazakii]
ARGVAGENQHGVPLRLPLFQQRLPPFGAGGAADFQRQRVVAVFRQAAEEVVTQARPFLTNSSLWTQTKIRLFIILISSYIKWREFPPKI